MLETCFAPRCVAIVVLNGARPLDVAGVLEVFEHAREVQSPGGRAYAIELASPTAPTRTSVSGMEVVTTRSLDECVSIDTLIVAGGADAIASDDGLRTIAWLRDRAATVRRIGSVGEGIFVLAEAGLLDGKRVTTHWASCAAVAARYPAVLVDPDPLFIRDGGIVTSAGATAGMDLALALVEEDVGRAVALAVARDLVLVMKRPASQSQLSAFLLDQIADTHPIQDLVEWIPAHLGDDLSIPCLARRARMSERNFARAFSRELGVSPARYVETLRVGSARHLLLDSNHPVKSIAVRCGFGSEESMRRAFRKLMHRSPNEYRKHPTLITA